MSHNKDRRSRVVQLRLSTAKQINIGGGGCGNECAGWEYRGSPVVKTLCFDCMGSY